MARSNLTTRFHVNTVNKFQKQYRQDNEDAKKKNIARYITVDVVNRKGVPDIEDCLLLIKLGNTNCDDQMAEDLLERWLDDENNKARGIAGAFCELCKDYCLDIPVDSLHKQQCDQLEEFINKRLDAQKKLNDLISKITELQDKVNATSKEVEDNNTEDLSNITEFKEVNTEEPVEVGVDSDNTQE
jgi:hypothetical protein